MRNYLLVLAMLLTACSGNRQDKLAQLMKDATTTLSQEKRVGPMVIRCTYLPACWDQRSQKEAPGSNEAEMSFRINVQSTNPGEVKEKGSRQMASYGVEENFQLIVNRDTLLPVLAQRIANGNLDGAEYLVIFPRVPLAPVQTMSLVYKDWVFSSTRLVFPFNKTFLQQSDSISCGL
ncbi:hypothetical protein [Chitinophaga solisilvae]|uniref:hypothetical protein n=1 Tax=Chitinophaga solisilvae TaxID=1233460 RepID=UPI001371F327|nr:hypothetical protein [Chitinophaga solisilvae]